MTRKLLAVAALSTIVSISASAAAHLEPACGPDFELDPQGRCIRRPVRYLVTDPPAPSVVTDVSPSPTPPEPARPSVTTVSRPADPYSAGLVITGGGVGGLMLGAAGAVHVSPSYLVHLGLAMGPAEFALRANLTPSALDLGGADVSLYATRATFNYRFVEGGAIHPVAGVGLESIVADPAGGPLGHSFAVTARAGVELAYKLTDTALALGLDATGHLPFAHTDAFPTDLSWMLGFGAYLDLRF